MNVAGADIGGFLEQGAPELNAMEIAILRGLADGLTSKEIAEALSRKKPTVESYIRTLYLKFDAKSRAQLVICAYRFGILTS